jgi:uncharacterized protein YebE (UPF0316 family)
MISVSIVLHKFAHIKNLIAIRTGLSIRVVKGMNRRNVVFPFNVIGP